MFSGRMISFSGDETNRLVFQRKTSDKEKERGYAHHLLAQRGLLEPLARSPKLALLSFHGDPHLLDDSSPGLDSSFYRKFSQMPSPPTTDRPVSHDHSPGYLHRSHLALLEILTSLVRIIAGDLFAKLVLALLPLLRGLA